MMAWPDYAGQIGVRGPGGLFVASHRCHIKDCCSIEHLIGGEDAGKRSRGEAANRPHGLHACMLNEHLAALQAARRYDLLDLVLGLDGLSAADKEMLAAKRTSGKKCCDCDMPCMLA